ncbi:MAG: dTMP kinase [Nocardioides sp.]
MTTMNIETSEQEAGVGMAALRTDTAAAIDAVATGPVLVEGSPPPCGRDLDLVAVPEDHAAISSWLHAAGFIRWGHTWARFGEPGAYGVELSSTERWQTSEADASSLFLDAEPIPGFRNLVMPSPAVVLLLAARGTVTRRGALTPKARRRVEGALARNPNAWEESLKLAGPLGMAGAVELLRRTYRSEAPLSPSARAAGLASVVRGGGPIAAKARVLLGARPRRLRPAVVSFSGLDGSGKSTQVTRLKTDLSELGIASVDHWAGFKNAALLRVRFPVLDRPSSAYAETEAGRDQLIPHALHGNRIGTAAWGYVVVLFNCAHLWRFVLLRPRGTKLLVFDRFSPDTMVKLDLRFTRMRGIDIRWQRKLFEVMSPKPDVGFLVDVSSEVAYGRRQEQTPQELADMAELYQEQVPRYRLHRLDGTRPADELAKEIVSTVWRGLR